MATTEPTRRQYLTYQLVLRGMSATDAIETVSNAARLHPGLDMEERRTWEAWRRDPTAGAREGGSA